MSDSDRGGRNQALGDYFAVLAAIILCSVIVGWLAYISGHNSSDKDHRSYEYEQAAKRNTQIACRDLEPAAIADCVYDEINSSKIQAQSEQDLDAQQWMALWAGLLTLISIGTTVISWIALRYLRDTFVKTAEGADATSEQTRISREQLQITKDQNKPLVLFHAENFSHESGNYCIGIVLKNFGPVPAIKYGHSYQRQILQAGALPNFSDVELTRDALVPSDQVIKTEKIKVPQGLAELVYLRQRDVWFRAKARYCSPLDRARELEMEFVARLHVVAQQVVGPAGPQINIMHLTFTDMKSDFT